MFYWEKKFVTKQISLLISIIEFAGIRKEKALTVYQVAKNWQVNYFVVL